MSASASRIKNAPPRNPGSASPSMEGSSSIFEKLVTIAAGSVIFNTIFDNRPKSLSLKKPARLRQYPIAMIATNEAAFINISAISSSPFRSVLLCQH